jgi:hypothetical protein
MNAEQLGQWELARETEVFGENSPNCHFTHKSNMTWFWKEQGPSRLATHHKLKDNSYFN